MWVGEWRMSVRQSVQVQNAELHAAKMHAVTMHAALEAQMRSQGQATGLRCVRRVLAQMVRGEVGMRVEVWRTQMQDDARGREVARMQREVEARAAGGRRGVAMKQLRRVVVRMMKGEVAMRVAMWHTSTRDAAHNEQLGPKHRTYLWDKCWQVWSASC